ncbi:MAG: hypothetical protein HKN47_03500 [Pirellulaceae bacterium]|nr:hypothetical protein [Pirellulaceae bacterium]
MSVAIPTEVSHADVCVGEVIWPKYPEANDNARQQQELIGLVDSAGCGVILDCTMVEIGNSEIINLLMRVRNHSKKSNKEIALFNVPDSLAETIRLCNLRSILPTASDARAAKQLVMSHAQGKTGFRIWAEMHMALASILAVGLSALLAVAVYMLI